MAKEIIYKEYNITAGGGTVNIPSSDLAEYYIVGASPAVVLLADQIYSASGSLYKGLTYSIIYNGGVTSNYSGGITVSFFGIDLTDAQAASRCKITAYYDGSAWDIQVVPDLSEQQLSPVIWGYLIEDGSIDTSKIANGKITYAKVQDASARGMIIRSGAGGTFEELDSKTSGNILLGDGTDIDSVAVSGDITIDGSGVTAIGSSKVLTVMIADDNVTVAKVENNLTFVDRDLLVSFETGEIGDFKIKTSFPGTVSEIYAYATKAIAATDNGTIVPKNNAGVTMGAGTITFTASDARGTAYTSTPNTNNTFVAGDILTFTSAKATAGGMVQLTIKLTRS